MTERPTCPDHPQQRSSNARNVAKGKREYICVVCCRVLGDAPDEGQGRWELETIAAGDARDVKAALPPAKEGPAPSPAVLVPHPHVRLDEDGVPVIKDTRIPIHRLWGWHRQGTPVETMLRRYPQLGPARIFDALAFAYDNLSLTDACFLRDRAMGGTG